MGEAGGKEEVTGLRRLVAARDTLGWTLAQEEQTDKLREAHGYLLASWTNVQAPVVGLHVGMVEERMGEPGRAMAAYLEEETAIRKKLATNRDG